MERGEVDACGLCDVHGRDCLSGADPLGGGCGAPGGGHVQEKKVRPGRNKFGRAFRKGAGSAQWTCKMILSLSGQQLL